MEALSQAENEVEAAKAKVVQYRRRHGQHTLISPSLRICITSRLIKISAIVARV